MLYTIVTIAGAYQLVHLLFALADRIEGGAHGGRAGEVTGHD